MYDQLNLREYCPLLTEIVREDDWLHIIGWRKFYANARGFNYTPVYAENSDHIIGFHEEEDEFGVLANDRFEAASDQVVGANNALSFALTVALFIEEVNLHTSLIISLATLAFQSAIRALFNTYEYLNTHNKNRNKLLKMSLAYGFLGLGLIGLTLLLATSGALLVGLMDALPAIVFAVGAIRAIVHMGYALANVALFCATTNPLEGERFLNQAAKRLVQTAGALAVSIPAGLILFKTISAAAISYPIKIALAAISMGALLYSTCREYTPLRTWQPLRYIFKDVNKKLDALSAETLEAKKIRYQGCIDQHQSPEDKETRFEKLFYHGGGIIEELNIIRNRNFYKGDTEEKLEDNAFLADKKETAQLFLQGIILDKLKQAEQEKIVLSEKSDFRFFRESDTSSNQHKINFLNCLLTILNTQKVSTEKSDAPSNSFANIQNLSDLERYLKENPAVRLSVFSAMSFKQGNIESIWRAVIKYNELFEPVKTLCCQAQPEATAESLTVKVEKEAFPQDPNLSTIDPIEERVVAKIQNTQTPPVLSIETPKKSTTPLSPPPTAPSSPSSARRSPISVIDSDPSNVAV